MELDKIPHFLQSSDIHLDVTKLLRIIKAHIFYIRSKTSKFVNMYYVLMPVSHICKIHSNHDVT